MGLVATYIESAGGEVNITELEQRDRRSVDADENEDGVHGDHEDQVRASSTTSSAG